MKRHHLNSCSNIKNDYERLPRDDIGPDPSNDLEAVLDLFPKDAEGLVMMEESYKM